MSHDQISSPAPTVTKTRRGVWLASLVVVIWLGIAGATGPLFGKLSSVQENNNSSFLPKGAEATQASELIQTFSGKDSFNFPALVLFEGNASPQSLAAINSHLEAVGELTLAGTSAKISDYLAPGQRITAFAAQDGKAILATVPLDGNALSKVDAADLPLAHDFRSARFAYRHRAH